MWAVRPVTGGRAPDCGTGGASCRSPWGWAGVSLSSGAGCADPWPAQVRQPTCRSVGGRRVSAGVCCSVCTSVHSKRAAEVLSRTCHRNPRRGCSHSSRASLGQNRRAGKALVPVTSPSSSGVPWTPLCGPANLTCKRPAQSFLENVLEIISPSFHLLESWEGMEPNVMKQS